MLALDAELIYLDNAATTFPKPETVYSFMDQFYRQYGGNAGRGANPLARKATTLVEETRSMLCSWLNVGETIFLPSATIALNTVILGAGLRSGDIVYVTPFEHNSVLRPLEHLRKTIGIEIRVLPFDKSTYQCKLEDTKKLFRLEPPTLICMTQTSNVLGLVIPVSELAETAKSIEPDCITLVDAAQAAGLRLLPISQIDALVWSGHKSLYGPYGVAGIAFGTDWRPTPTIRGGTGTVSESIDMPEEGVSRFEAGSQNISAIAGLNAALKWLHATGREEINARVDKLTMLVCSCLADFRATEVYIPHRRELLSGIVSFSIAGVKPQTIETALGAQNVAVRAGFHCSPWAHEFIGTKSKGGTVRISVGNFNTEQDIFTFCEILESIVK